MPLTRKQISSLTEFSERKLHENAEHKAKIINTRLKQYGVDMIVTPDGLLDFYKNVVPKFTKELQREYFIKSQNGTIDSNLTPTDKSKTNFPVIEKPVVGQWYHLSWAFKGAKFKLQAINGEKGTVWTGHTNNRTMEINLKDLRGFSKW